MIVVVNLSLSEDWGMKNIKELAKYAEARETILLHVELGAIIRDSDRKSFDRKYRAVRKSVRKESIIVDASDLLNRSLKRLADEEAKAASEEAERNKYAEEVKKIDDEVRKAHEMHVPYNPHGWRRSTSDLVFDGAGRYRGR